MASELELFLEKFNEWLDERINTLESIPFYSQTMSEYFKIEVDTLINVKQNIERIAKEEK